jgi:hypothetical protein
MRPVGIQQTADGKSRRTVLTVVALGVLALIFALALGACGGTEETTTTTAGQPQATTTTTLAGGLTPITEPAGGATTTVSLAEGEATTTTTPTGGETTTTAKELSPGEEVLPDGHIKVMGFIKNVREKDGKRYVTIDYAEMLTGQAALDAARAAGDIGPDEEVPNDYYISNPSTDKHEFEVSAGAAMTTSSWHGEMNKTLTWDVFKSFWSVSPPDEEASFLRDSPWWIERDGQTVVKIDEQYLP